MANALFSPYNSYILYDAVWTGTAPMTTYSLSDLTFIRPDWRIKWNNTSVTITATLGGSRKADVVAVPMSNIDVGATKLTLTNGAGLSQAITIPALPSDSTPLTAVLDLRPLATAGTRTSNVWNFVIAANSVNVTMGAALWLGTLTEFDRNIRLGRVRGEKRFNSAQDNFYGTFNNVRGRTRRRYIDAIIPAQDSQYASALDWMRSGEGSALPSLFWPDATVNDALLGAWPDDFSAASELCDYHPVPFRFTERAKGIPFL